MVSVTESHVLAAEFRQFTENKRNCDVQYFELFLIKLESSVILNVIDSFVLHNLSKFDCENITFGLPAPIPHYTPVDSVS